jgi:hypothetical protein
LLTKSLDPSQADRREEPDRGKATVRKRPKAEIAFTGKRSLNDLQAAFAALRADGVAAEKLLSFTSAEALW